MRFIKTIRDKRNHWSSVDSFASSQAISATERIKLFRSLGANAAFLTRNPMIKKAAAYTFPRKQQHIRGGLNMEICNKLNKHRHKYNKVLSH